MSIRIPIFTLQMAGKHKSTNEAASRALRVIALQQTIIVMLFLFSFHFLSSQTFRALTYDEYETYLTVQTKRQAQLKSGYKMVSAEFRMTYKTDYKKLNSLFPSFAPDTKSANRELPDTVFHLIVTGQVTFIGNLKRNDTIINKVFHIAEEDVSTTLDSAFKKRRTSYGNYILDTKGKIVGEIIDFGNHTFQSIQDDKLLILSSKHVPGKTSFIDPFSRNLIASLKSDTSNMYIFAEVKYFEDSENQKIKAH